MMAAAGSPVWRPAQHDESPLNVLGLPDCIAWTLGARKDLEHLRLRAWAHMLGFRGHFSTKSRRYSTTLGALRDARAQWRRAQAAAAMPERENATTYVLAHWIFAGTGLADTEAWLATSLEPAPGTEGEPTHA